MTTSTLPSAPASQDEYLTLVAACREASARYYDDGDTPLDDATYDQYTAWIEAWEAAHPGQVSPDSPTGKVGGGTAPTGDVAHSVPMQSLEKAKTSEQLACAVRKFVAVGQVAYLYSLVTPPRTRVRRSR